MAIAYKDLCNQRLQPSFQMNILEMVAMLQTKTDNKQHTRLLMVLELPRWQLPGGPKEGLCQLEGMISVHIYPPACLYGRIYSLFSQPFPIHVFYPENKEEHNYAQMPNQWFSEW